MASNNKRSTGNGLSIMEYADYELLQTMDKENVGTSQELAAVLDREVRAVGSRLAWMRKMGLVDRTIAKNWKLTSKGQAVISSDRVGEVRRLTSSVRSNQAFSWVVKREFNRNLR